MGASAHSSFHECTCIAGVQASCRKSKASTGLLGHLSQTESLRELLHGCVGQEHIRDQEDVTWMVRHLIALTVEQYTFRKGQPAAGLVEEEWERDLEKVRI